jgi:DNA-binding NarL/FixJ family response regulator
MNCLAGRSNAARGESDIAVVAIVHQLADAIDAVRDRRADVLIVDSALLGGSSDFTLGDHRKTIGRARQILLSPNVNKHRRWASQRRAVDVVSSLDSPDRLLEVIRCRS